MVLKIIYIIALILFFLSCQNKEKNFLREKLASIELSNKQISVALTPALIKEYRHAELAINHRYVNEVNSIISEDFAEKLEVFEDKEFGFFRSYKHMFKVLLEDEGEWTDYWNLKKSKYFSNLTTHEKLHECYKSYNSDIQKLRGQILKSSKCASIPKEVRYNIDDYDVSLSGMSQHSYANLVIEFGTDIAVWLLILGIVSVISLVVGCAAPPTWVVTLITIIISVVLSIWNDNRMLSSIKEQYQTQITLNNADVLNELNKSTNSFYDYISK